jgi:predicted Zn-dependent protease
MNPRNVISSFALLMFLGACATGDSADSYDAAFKDDQAAEKPQKLEDYQVASLSPGNRPPLNSDEAGLWMKMDNAEKRLKTSGNIIHDRGLNRYLKKVVCRVSKRYCNDVRVYAVRMPYFNASMAPNGTMQIWSGLMLRAKNEAQLAAVLGHELGHYLRRHSLQQMRKSIETASTMAFFHVATLGITAGISDLMAAGSLRANSRNHEREADGYGVVLMTDAGYNPREAAKVWKRLLRERAADKSDNGGGAMFLSTHPGKKERVVALKRLSKRAIDRHSKQQARKRRKQRLTVGNKSYARAMRKHRSTFLRDELNLRRFDRSQELLKMLMEDGSNVAELHYFQGELYRLRNKKGDTAKAIASYRTALRSRGRPPAEVHRDMGLILHKQRKQGLARRSLAMYLKKNPKAEDAEMIRYMLK